MASGVLCSIREVSHWFVGLEGIPSRNALSQLSIIANSSKIAVKENQYCGSPLLRVLVDSTEKTCGRASAHKGN